MPDPDRLLNTLSRAIAAFRATPGRRGRVVTLPDTAEVMVAGDLHGQVAYFRRLLHCTTWAVSRAAIWSCKRSSTDLSAIPPAAISRTNWWISWPL